MVTIATFFSFAQEDSALRKELDDHLSLLQRQGVLRAVDNGCISPGDDWTAAIARQIDAAQVVVLLISASYVASDYLYHAEMGRALERQRCGQARVIPVLLRDCDLTNAPFGDLQMLPEPGIPVTSQHWGTRDDAWTIVARGIRAAIDDLASGIGVTGGQRTESARFSPIPKYASEAIHALSNQLEDARARRRALHDVGVDVAAVDREVLELRRRLREGGQLREGDSLGEGRFLLLRRLGKGGFAVVWEALDRTNERRVAIKVLHPELARDSSCLERFVRGARIMATISHDAVVEIVEPYGEDGGYHFFAMELMANGDLHSFVIKNRPSTPQVLSAILRIGDALALAHQRGLVHRDVKPANVLLDALGSPKLTDFDLVFDVNTTGGTRTGALGSFLYAAPELMSRPQDADARADVYGLGMTTIFALSGTDPTLEFVRDAYALMDSLPCTTATREVLKRAVSLNKGPRHKSALEFCDALRAALRTRRRGSPSVRGSEASVLPPEAGSNEPRITVIGCGGAGNHTVDALVNRGLDCVELIAIDTDPVMLAASRIPRKILLGIDAIVEGGAVPDADKGRSAALADATRIKELVTRTDLLIIVAGFGGGAGTGIAPVIAQLAQETRCTTVGVALMPFSFEGRHRMRRAELGVAMLAQYANGFLTVSNQNLVCGLGDKSPFDEFDRVDDLLYQIVSGVCDLVTQSGIVNVDIFDVKNLLEGRSTRMFFGRGRASGQMRARAAAQLALSSSLLRDTDIGGATGALINIVGGLNMRMREIEEAATLIQEKMHEDANIIFGATVREDIGDAIEVSLIAIETDRTTSAAAAGSA
jgi:eukaryotic-like serine/threonine-protein kinase